MTETTTTDAVVRAALNLRAAWQHTKFRADQEEMVLARAVDELLAAQDAAAQALIADSTRAFAAADGTSERVEVICDLLTGWYAAWPSSAVTDPHEGIAWHLVSLLDTDRTRAQLLTELTAGKRPCPWCPTAPVFDSAEDLLTHARSNHLDARAHILIGDLVPWLRRAIADPGSIASYRRGPHWPQGHEGWEEQAETLSDWTARAILAVIAHGGRPRCERCCQVILVNDAYEPPLPGVGLWQHAGECPPSPTDG